MYDSLDDGTVNKKTVSPKKEVLELQLEKEMTADLQESISNNNKANGEQITSFPYNITQNITKFIFNELK